MLEPTVLVCIACCNAPHVTRCDELGLDVKLSMVTLQDQRTLPSAVHVLLVPTPMHQVGHQIMSMFCIILKSCFVANDIFGISSSLHTWSKTRSYASYNLKLEFST